MLSLGNDSQKQTKKSHYMLMSLTEMKAWFGLSYLHAAIKLNTTDMDIVWYHENSNDIFSATMQWKRFTFLTRIVQFNNVETCKEHWNHNKFAAFHNLRLWTTIFWNCESCLHIWWLMKLSIPTKDESA